MTSRTIWPRSTEYASGLENNDEVDALFACEATGVGEVGSSRTPEFIHGSQPGDDAVPTGESLAHQPSLPVNCEGRRAIASRARRNAMADLLCLCGATARPVLSASDASFGSASQASE